MIDSQGEDHVATPATPSSAAGCSSTKKGIFLIAAVAVIAAIIVIPVSITQLNRDSGGKASTESLTSGADANNDGGLVLDATTSPTFDPTLAPTTGLPTVKPTLAPTTVNPTTTTTNPTFEPTLADTAEPSPLDSTISTINEPVLGEAAGTPYYHCPANPNLKDDVHHIVLLHGASFTKEIWVQKGILQQFCAEPTVSATALDMSFGTYTTLQTILDALEEIPSSSVQKPVVLVTPSAGGTAVVDWMINGDVNTLREYVSVWIPVAVGSLSSATDEQVQNIAPLRVLAIYGDGDTSGGRHSQRLARLVGATVVELSGGHPVYRDSPDEFVAAILEYLGV
jgi:pimeloyl-ACP methyl ester carboxylesterase